MKRRNADIGKLRRPLKRTKITEGMYGNSMLYLKFVMVWASIVLADYMLEFRFEFLWPFWMMLRSVYDSYKYQGLAFSVFFICIALTSDMICFFFIPVQYIFFAASTYVWVQYVWYSYKGICLPTVAICCFIVYMEGVRGTAPGSSSAWAAGGSRGLAAHAVGFPAVTLGVGVKAYVGRRLRARTQRQVRQQNEFYFQLMRDAVPMSGLPSCEAGCMGECECGGAVPPPAPPPPAPPAGVGGAPGVGGAAPAKPANGTARRRFRQENGHCVKEKELLQSKLDQLEQHLERKQAKEREKSQNPVTNSHTSLNPAGNSPHPVGNSNHPVVNSHVHSNGVASGPGCQPDEEDKHIHSKGGAKSSKYDKKEANTLKEDRRKHKNRDKELVISLSCDSHKSTEQNKEQINNSKEVESTTESVKTKELNGNSKERDREAREKERETREREREARERDREAKEREKEREREREQREKEARAYRETIEEVKRVRTELSGARAELAGARGALAAARATEAGARAAEADAKRQLAAEKQKRQERHTHTKTCSWGRERTALERRLAEERRARHQAEQQLQHNQENGWCQRCAGADSEAAALRRELARARDAHRQLQRDLQHAHDQVRSMETSNASTEAGSGCTGACAGAGAGAGGGAGAGAGAGWAARAGQLERALSAETRVKLDLLSALGDANRRMHIQDSIINRQEKELEELKAQMLAVMPTEFVGVGVGVATSVSKLRVSKLRLPDTSPLDPNASVYTPKQLCSDA